MTEKGTGSNNMRNAVIAVDVGGTKIAAGVFLEDGRVLHRAQHATCQESADASVEQLLSIVGAARDTVPADVSILAVGMVIPGWVQHRQGTVWAPNIQGWDHLALESRIAGKLPAPLILDSDRSAYVAGESWLGAARGLSDVVFLAVGSGIGAGILADGRILHGHDDLAGAVGWMALNPRYQDSYARMGCFEAEASGLSVGRKSAERDTPDADSCVSANARDVVAAAECGDAEAQALLEEVGVYLGMGVANLVSTLNPQMVVLGGGLFQSGHHLLDQVRREFCRWAQPFAAERVRVELSALGPDAGLAGAARLAFVAAARSR